MEKERLKYFMDGLKKEPIKEKLSLGGQSCGMFPSGIRLTHEDTKFQIEVEGSKSQLKNLNFAVTVFELYLEEFYK